MRTIATTMQNLHDIAQRLAPAPVQAVVPTRAGANSRVFRVQTTAGSFALKSYPVRPGDLRPRAAVEWQALTFLRERGVMAVPQPIARDAEGQHLLMEWIDAEPLVHHLPADIAAAASFLVTIFALSADPAAANFPLASEACLSAGEIIRQIDRRLAEFAPSPPVAAFLAESIGPALDATRRKFATEPGASEELAVRHRRLIPADFGFHNAMRASNGDLRFVDFDYFGWDDPVKLTADFILHPGMQLSLQDKRAFVAAMVAARGDDEHFAARFSRLLPLHAQRWALILLNPFRRDRTAELPPEPAASALLADRIGKARAVLGAKAQLFL
jgi:hypothetical protein